jgi:ATP-dependent exoDNAse (exonuclease V) alpha subunit
VNVYRESNRVFAEGDRIQFRAPFSEHRIANGELGIIGKITEEELTVALDSGREVSFEPDKFRHLDHGYAVTSYSSQSQTVDRVLVNADANESDLLLNQRMGYVAVSRAREDAVIFTNSIEQLSTALDRRVDKEMALEALNHTQHQTQLDRDLTQGGPLGYEQRPGQELDSIERGSEGTYNENQGSAEELEIEMSSD